jgi:uncharacterized BrkB/YihY/UPF0761 family membrane protein
MFQRPLESGRALATRALRIPIVAELAAAFGAFEAVGGSLLSSALAFGALFALLAGLAFAVGLVGFAFDDPARREAAVSAITAAVPGFEAVAREGLTTLASSSGALSLVGLIGSAWAASNFYDVLDDAIVRVMPGGRARGLFHRRRRGVLAVAVLAGAGFTALAIRIGLAALLTYVDGTLLALVLGALELALGLAVLTVGLLAIYRFVPVTPPSVRAAALPALAAALGIRVTSELFGFAAPILVQNFQIFGFVVSVLALLLWLSWACRILLLGAAWAAVRRDRAAAPDSPPS